MSEIFVFGSNLAGRHGLGAALAARRRWGAEYGVGHGRTGHAYAIPTKGFDLERLRLDEIAGHVEHFLRYARVHPELTFIVTRVGCGLASYKDEQMAPLFRAAPSNCKLPDGWRKMVYTPQAPHTGEARP